MKRIDGERVGKAMGPFQSVLSIANMYANRNAAAFSSVEAAIIAAFLALSVSAIVYVEIERSWQVQAAKERYIQGNHENAVEVARTVRSKFRQVYQGMRTIARLPGVRSIDRYARNFDEDARRSAQEIYNNLAENVAVSELYIVPVDFDPDAKDPATGKPQEPITTFDELIVGKTADTVRAAGDKEAVGESQSGIEEIEIFEYRLMKKQIAALQKDFGLETLIRGLSYPAIVGEEVITCDNTRYSLLSPNDEDRKGLVYSVPFYGQDGRMRGIVSAVILTAVVRDLLPNGTFAIHNGAYSFTAGSAEPGLWQDHLGDIAKNRSAHQLIYSETIPVNINDVVGGWTLWAGEANRDFFASVAVVASSDTARFRTLLIALGCLALCLATHLLLTRHRHLALKNEELEARVAERTRELMFAKDEAEEANKCKTAFLANVSHEIRNPLSAVIGMSELLAQSKLNDKQKQQLNVVRTSSEALLSLASQVLDFSAAETGRISLSPSHCSIPQLINDVVDLFRAQAARKGLKLISQIDPEVPNRVLADGSCLRQVLINLVSNALKFTEQGEIRIGVSNEGTSQDGILTLAFTVTDTGVGIDPIEAKKMFDAFQKGTASYDGEIVGIGLGLSICRHLVELMDGRIDCQSTPGRGTRMAFTIKAPTDSAELIPTAEQTTDMPDEFQFESDVFANMRVLVVDDNPHMREWALSAFLDFGCQISVASNGQEAIKMHLNRPFDIIFMDCRMPVLDGYSATQIIRQKEQKNGLKSVPIIAITANIFEADRQKCRDAGMTGFLEKPANLQKLYETLKSHL